jgi:hypothetical protein
VLNETGQVVHRTQVRGLDELLPFLKGLPDRFEVCYEGGCVYGHYHDPLQPLAAWVLVAHPGQLRLIFRSQDKNDRKDAERLAKLLYLGEAPTAHVPSVHVRTWRELSNCRSQVIAKRTRPGEECRGTRSRRSRPRGKAFFRRTLPQPGAKGVLGERTPGRQAVTIARVVGAL